MDNYHLLGNSVDTGPQCPGPMAAIHAVQQDQQGVSRRIAGRDKDRDVCPSLEGATFDDNLPKPFVLEARVGEFDGPKALIFSAQKTMTPFA